MGEIAEAMLDGELCEQCGVYMGDACGYPRTCGDCKRDAACLPPQTKIKCKKCGKLVKSIGMANHIKDAHGIGRAAPQAQPAVAEPLTPCWYESRLNQVCVKCGQMREYSDACNAALQSQVRVLRDALTHISLCSQNSASSKEECGRMARAALEATK